LTLPLIHLLLEKAVAFLLHVEVYDAPELFLPDFESIYVYIIADVPEGMYSVKQIGKRVTNRKVVGVKIKKHPYSNDLRKL
jgi:hypothetical protein